MAELRIELLGRFRVTLGSRAVPDEAWRRRKPAALVKLLALAPDAEGVFDRHLSAVVGHGYSDVCIVASITARAPVCPAPVEDGTVWTQLAVPPL